MRKLLSLLLIGLVGTASGAAADPSLALIKQMPNRTRNVVLANEDGSGQSVIYNSKDSSPYVRAGGPRSNHMLLLVETGKASILRYNVGAAGASLASVQLLPITNGSADLSPDGTSVAYFDTGTKSYRLFRLTDGSRITLAPLLAGYGGGTIVFTRDGGSVLFYTRNINTGVPRYYTVPVTGGTPIEVPVSNSFTDPEPSLDGGFLADVQNPSAIYRVPPGGGGASYVTNGGRPSLSCADSAMFFQVQSGTTVQVFRRDLATGATVGVTGAGFYGPTYLKPC